MRVSIIDYTKTSRKVLENILSWMNSIQKEFQFIYLKSNLSNLSEKIDLLSLDRVVQLLPGNIENNKIAIWDIQIQDNWFSKTDNSKNYSIITIKDWDVLSHLNLESYLVMEITENLSEQLLCHPDLSYVHEPPIGCVSDMCMYKTDINLKILTGYICPNCMTMFKEKLNNPTINAFMALLSLARDYALNKIQIEKIYLEENIVFPVAVYLRKLKGEPDITKKFYLLLDLFDVVVRTSTLILLARIKEISPGYTSLIEERNPTLGSWVNAFGAIYKSLDDQKDGLFASYFQSFRLAHTIMVGDSIVRLRNDTKGHGFTLQPHEINSYYREYYPKIMRLIQSLSNLLSLKLCRVIKLHHDRENGYKLEVFNLNGSNMIFVREELKIFPKNNKIEPLLTDDEILLFNFELTEYISMHPFIIHATCPFCCQPRTLILDFENKYLDLQMGHRIELMNGN